LKDRGKTHAGDSTNHGSVERATGETETDETDVDHEERL
jgi:hypothetical protein